MVSDNGLWSRRTVLKSLVGSAAVVGVSGAAEARSSNDDAGNDAGGGGSSEMRLSQENALTRKETKQKIEDISKKYGTEIASTVVPGRTAPTIGSFETKQQVTTDRSGPGSTWNLNYLNTWNSSYEVHGGTPRRLLLTTDHFISVYKSNRRDAQGRYRYFYWMWSQTETNNDYWHAETHLNFMRNYINFRSNKEELTHFSPSSTSDLNGRQKNIGVSVGFEGISFGISGSVYIKDATFGPETGRIDQGKAGEFSATIDANSTQGRQSLNATAVTRQARNRSGFYDCKWGTYCRGHV